MSFRILITHPCTRAVSLHSLYPNRQFALQRAIWIFKQEIESSSLRDIVKTRLYVGDNDEIDAELQRLRLHIVRIVDTTHIKNIPNIYSVLADSRIPWLKEFH
jgi:hypothetical protein